MSYPSCWNLFPVHQKWRLLESNFSIFFRRRSERENVKTCRTQHYSVKMLKDTFIGLWTTSINDALRTGNYKYAELCKEAANKFKCKNKQRDNLKCSSSQIRSSENIFPIHENEYILRLQKLLISSKFSIFRYLDAKAAWVTNARPAKGIQLRKLQSSMKKTLRKIHISVSKALTT